MRKIVVLLLGIALLVGGAVVGYRLSDGHVPFVTDTCRVFAGTHQVKLQPEQVRHAATITAVGARNEVPERAIVVALATAMQESELRNLGGGDRDSIGLFQQRPSQGWGTPEQLRDPRYATAIFYERLLDVPGWEKMRVTDAAQTVQRSAHPELYQKWEADAVALTSVFLGSSPGGLSCALREQRAAAGDAAVAGLVKDLQADWGTMDVGQPESDAGPLVSVTAEDEVTGWRVAHWMVAWSRTYGVESVTYAGRTWTAKNGKWEAAGEGSGADTRAATTVSAQIAAST
jgi:hypothetical protein